MWPYKYVDINSRHSRRSNFSALVPCRVPRYFRLYCGEFIRKVTHVLYILLEPRLYSEHNGEVGKFFRAVETEVVSIQDGIRKKAPWPGSLMQLSHMADDMERSGKGTVAAAIIECPPLQVQTVPFQSVSQSALRGEIVRDTWKSFFMQHIEQGVPM